MTFSTAGRILGGWSVDRSVFRQRLPDARWYVYAAGLVNPGDANTATLTLRYVKDDGTTVTLGTNASTGATLQKRVMGPFSLFGTGGVPAGETVVVIELHGVKSAGVDGTARHWTCWTRYLPSAQ